MSNGRWGTRSAPHVQIAPQQSAPLLTGEEMVQAAQEMRAQMTTPTVDGLLGQAKVRLEFIEAELRTKTALEAEKAKLERMIAALEEA